MEDNDIRLTHEIYLESLAEINGIAVTHREVDIIACLVDSKKPAEIASYLFIDKRTVSTHISNIKNKFNLRLINEIARLIQDFDRLEKIFNIYLKNLSIRIKFENQLRKLSRNIRSAGPFHYEAIYKNQADIAVFVKQLKSHLKYSGISIRNKDENNYRSIVEFLSNTNEDLCYIVYLMSMDSIPSLNAGISPTNLEKIGLKASHHSGEVVLNKEPLISPQFSTYTNNQQYDLSLEKIEYYFTIFKILKKLDSRINLEQLIKDFKNEIKIITTCKDPGNAGRIWYSFLDFSLKMKLWFFGSSFCCLFFIIMISLITTDNKTNKNTQTNPSIRSESSLPPDYILLKRPHLMNQISTKLSGQQGIQTVSLVGVVGMGGVGKTTLAREFGHSQKASVVWELNAESKESLINSLRDLAYALAKTKEKREELRFIQSIQDTEEKEKQLCVFVKSGLREKNNWLLIYDNVEVFSKIKDYFPHDQKVWGSGRVVVTTRDKNIENSSYINPENVISIEELSNAESLTLFSKIIHSCDPKNLSSEKRQKAINFLQKIPPFPLDISVAAYYIRRANITYEQYLERLMKNSEKLPEVIPNEINGYTKTRYGIIVSSLEKLMNQNKDFKELLFFISLVDSQNIPRNLLEYYKKSSNVDKFIYELRKSGLITNESFSANGGNSCSFSLHRSTQALSLSYFFNLLDYEEKKKFVEQMLQTINHFRESFLAKSNGAISNQQQEIFTSLVSHLEMFIKNLRIANFSNKEREKYEQDLILNLGYIYYKYINNYILGKKYLSETLKRDSNNNYLLKESLVSLITNLGNLSANLQDHDDALIYAKESLKLCKTIKDSEILSGSNLRTIGIVYANQNDFQKAKYYFEQALNKISKVDYETRKYLESDIYEQLASLYSTTYLHKEEACNAEKYAIKSLELLNAFHIFYNEPIIKKVKDLQYIAKHKVRLGEVYSRLGKYTDALEQGFKEAKYILNAIENPPHYLLNNNINENTAQIFLRKGYLEIAEEMLTKSILLYEKLIGEHDTLRARTFRIEARIRLGKLTEAYEDCTVIFNLKKRERNNHLDLLYYTNFYNSAIVKYKQGALEKSIKYFSDFFKNIEIFCKNFLDEGSYRELKLNGVFDEIIYAENQKTQQIKKSLQLSLIIFNKIYSNSHPFVKDYVEKNYDDAQKL